MSKKIVVSIIVILIIIIGGAIAYFNTKKSDNTNNESINNINENNDNINVSNNNTTNTENTSDETTSDKKSLVVYFSATNTTEGVAEKIAEVTNSDITEIIPKEEYTSEDLNYNNDDCRANKEQNDDSSRPEIQNSIAIDDYDVIYIGYPIWWGTVPKIIYTLLDSYNFNGKTVIPFCTSGGSGISQSLSDLKEYNSNVNWLEGRRFSSSVSNSEIENWVNELGL